MSHSGGVYTNNNRDRQKWKQGLCMIRHHSLHTLKHSSWNLHFKVLKKLKWTSAWVPNPIKLSRVWPKLSDKCFNVVFIQNWSTEVIVKSNSTQQQSLIYSFDISTWGKKRIKNIFGYSNSQAETTDIALMIFDFYFVFFVFCILSFF